MADFCQECSIEIFGEDTGDLAGLITAEEIANGQVARALCEECGGIIFIDENGRKVPGTTVFEI